MPRNGISGHEEATAHACAPLGQCTSKTNTYSNLDHTTQASICTDIPKARVPEIGAQGDLPLA